MTTSVIYADATDGYIDSGNAAYATARSGGTLSVDTTATNYQIGQYESKGYHCDESFAQFNTNIGSGASISSAVLSLYGGFGKSVTAPGAEFTIEARVHDWGVALTSADWVAGASLSAKTLVAHFASSGWVTAAYNDFVNDAMPANVNKTGQTLLLLDSSRHVGNNTPGSTGTEYVQPYSTDQTGTTTDPKLTLTYTNVQTVSPSAIASAEAFGTDQLNMNVTGAGAIASGEAIGAPTVSPGPVTISPSGIATAEALGSATVTSKATISPSGIASAEALGAAVVSAKNTISPSGIATGEALGAAVLTALATISPAGIASAEALGADTVTSKATVSPAGIAAAEALGAAIVSALNTISPSGIASAEAIGDHAIGTILQPSAIASDEAVPSPTVSPGPVTVSPSGIASDEAFGVAQLNLTLSPPAIVSAELVPSPVLTTLATISPSSITSAEALGSATVSPGVATISPAGIVSAEAFGVAQLNLKIYPASVASGEVVPGPVVTPLNTVSPAGIATAEAFGTAQLYFLIGPSGIASAEAFGVAKLGLGISSAGAIASGEALGVPRLSLVIYPAAIASAEALGVPRLVRYILPVGIASAEAFGTAAVRYVLRMRRLHLVQYHALVYAPTASGGPGLPKLELDPDILNLVWQQNQNLPGQAAFALQRHSKKFDQIEWMVDHIKIFRESSSGTQTVFAGKLIKPMLSATDILCYAWDYLAFLQLSITGYKTMYPNKLIGSEVMVDQWVGVLFANLQGNSPLEFVASGTFQDPLGLDGVTPIKTNATFGVSLFDRLFTFYTLAEMAMANTSNNVKFEITRTLPHTFNFWKNYGANKTDFVAVFPGNVMEMDFDGGHDNLRNELTTVLSDGLGGRTTYKVSASDAGSTTMKRLMAAIPIRTLFGTSAGTTETDQQKAALARQLIVATRYPRDVRIRARQGEIDIFNGHDLGDKFRVINQKADRSGDFYDGYLRLVGVAGAWDAQHGEMIDLYLRGSV